MKRLAALCTLAFVSLTALARPDELVAVYQGSRPPFSFSDAHGKAEGIEVDMVTEALRRTGRGVVLTMTPKGKKAWQRTMQVVGRRNQDIFGVLSEAERAQLSDFFDRLIEKARAGGEAGDAEE